QVGSLCVWWAALALGAGGAERMSGARVRWAPAGGALLVVAALAWAAEYPLGFWGATAAPVGLHPGLWIAALIGGAAIILAWRRAKPAQSAVVARVGRWVCAAGVLVIMFTATSFEVARWASLWAQDAMARQGALSIYWGLFAVGLLIAGFRRGVPAARYCGLALLGTAGVKAVVIDLSSAPPEWRIASFTALGLLMVGVAAGYARVAGRLGGRGE